MRWMRLIGVWIVRKSHFIENFGSHQQPTAR